MRYFLSVFVTVLLLAGCQPGGGSASPNPPEGVTIEGDTAFAEASVIYAKDLNGNWGVELDTTAMEKQDRWLKKQGFTEPPPTESRWVRGFG